MVDDHNTDRPHTPLQPGAMTVGDSSAVMSDGTVQPADTAAPGVAARPPTAKLDNTVKLDRAIVMRDPSLPARFGRYRVTARIGVGGFATVYSAVDPELDAAVAIKVLAENHSADVEIRRRFLSEARVARRVSSDRLIGVFDIGETDDGRPYVVMELADRGTLRARMTCTPGRPDGAMLVRLVEELAACLTAIHGKGVVHRDIKPTNLLLRSNSAEAGPAPTRQRRELLGWDEGIVLADFGLARDISGGASALTVGGGTVGYMSPEQADPRGKPDIRADIYAATVVLAEVATGRHPERLDLATAALSPAVRQALSDGMAFDRELRPESARAWRDQLLAALEGDFPTELIRSEPHASPQPPTYPVAASNGSGRTPARTSVDDLHTVVELRPHHPTTRIQAPYPYNRDLFPDTDSSSVADGAPSGRDRPTLVPTEDLTARSFVEEPDDHCPPPPPSLPHKPHPRPPELRRQGPAAPRPPAGPRPAASPSARSLTVPPPPTPAQSSPPPVRPPVPPPPPPRVEPTSQRPNPTRSRPATVSATEAEICSRRHLKTAQRLAKLEQREQRKQNRRRRRRRRIVRVVNFFLALIRGAITAGIAAVTTAAYLSSRTGVQHLGPRGQALVTGATFTFFFLGIAFFPWPRGLDKCGGPTRGRGGAGPE